MINVGSKVAKISGYPYIGEVVAKYGEGDDCRYVVVFAASTMQHIFSPKQIAVVSDELYEHATKVLEALFANVAVVMKMDRDLSKTDG